ncbi:MAG: hypothetical protein ACP5HM_01325 [Anaerolineae bacterium]
MATEETKKKRLRQVFNIMVYGLARGLWDLFGEASFATTNSIGDKVLEIMEQEMGLEIAGEDPESILIEIERLLVDEIGTMRSGRITIEGNLIRMACTKCVLREATKELEDAGVQPFACLPMTIAAATMRKRLGTRHRLLGRDWDPETETCTIKFEIIT